MAARVKEYTLVVSIFATSMLLWIVSPLVALWAASRFTDDGFTIVFSAGGIFLPLLVTAFGFALARMNGAYYRTARPPRQVLEVSLTISVLVAATALMAYFLFFAHNANPGQPGM